MPGRVRFADLALPLVLGGLMPATLFWCTSSPVDIADELEAPAP